jgi:proton-translocating NADH-quinone oxidoreductase chain M
MISHFLNNSFFFYSDFFFFKTIIFLNILAIFFLLIIPEKHILFFKQFSLIISLKLFLITFLTYSIHLIFLSKNSSAINLTNALQVVTFFELYNNKIAFCVDNISLLLIVLTTFITFICITISLELPKFKLFSLCFFIMSLLLFIVWTTFDIFIFYIFFESVLIPMFIVINFWGSRARKIRAAYLFFMYTVAGSLPMLLAILYIYAKTGTTNIFVLQLLNSPFAISDTTFFSFSEQKWLWLAFFLAFAVKVPMLPVHLWLPEAHVEAPTAGSVILAGVLLKLGSYGMLRFLNPLFSLGGVYFTPAVQTLAICSVVYAALTALRQNDLKRVIAYASISHMNLIVLGIFSLSVYAVEGAVFQMISHGLVASLLFLMVGILYDRSGTRLINNYSGLAIIMPTFASYFLIATIANMAFPFTCNFIGEILLFIGIFMVNTFTGFLSAFGIFLCATYSIWLYNRVFCGNLADQITSFTDIDYLDTFIIQIFVFLILLLGAKPQYITNFIYLDSLYIIS